MTSNKTAPKGEGFEITDSTAATQVGKELETLGMSLQNASTFMEERPLKDSGFGSMPSDSPAAAKEFAAKVDMLVTSLGYAQQFIAGTASSIKTAMTTYDGMESEHASTFKSLESKV